MVLFEIVCHPNAAQLLAELREEAEAIMPKLGKEPTAVREMVKLDSVIRETLRHTAINAHGLTREVVKPGGLITPDGVHLPQGCHVCVPVDPLQRDEDRCENGNEMQPMRFYEKAASSAEQRQLPAVQISEDFLSFGLGKHACPGKHSSRRSNVHGVH